MDEFHNELNNLKICRPGSAEVHFSDNRLLRDLVKQQYPDWKVKGKVTSVPAVRVPALFLGPEMMSEKLNSHYERIQKGEEGELKLYRKFLDGFGLDHDGIIILPNLDTNGLFKSKSGVVEIDMLVLHPSKGIFIVSVKNRKMGDQRPGMDGAAVEKFEDEMKEKLKKEMLKHTDFIMQLSNYKTSPCSSSSSSGFIPLHAVFCQLSWNSENMQDLETNKEWYTYNDTEHVLMFQQPDFLNFQKNWSEKVSKICDIEMHDHFETTVARLVALSSMDSATALIHDKMISNSLQSIQVKQKDLNTRLDQQFANTSGNIREDSLRELKNDMKKEILESNRNQSKRGKMKVILWTKEQLEIIAEVYDALTKKSGVKPLRLVVKGPHGSGKTMLLVYLAKLAEVVFAWSAANHCKRVVICDGTSGQSQLLFQNFLNVFKESKVEIWTKNDPEKVNSIKEGIIFIDEYRFFSEVVNSFNSMDASSKNVIICVFTFWELADRFSKSSDTRVLTLSYVLRSTSKLAEFCNNVQSQFQNSEILKGNCAHNLEGEPPVVQFVESRKLLEVLVELIKKCSKSPFDYGRTLVGGAFLSPAFTLDLKHSLTSEKIEVIDDKNLIKMETGASDTHKICLLRSCFGGAEFCTVIVPFEAANRRPIEVRFFYGYCTRATMRLIVLVEEPLHASPRRELNRTEIWDWIKYV
ncbi:uncharacterized protein LOC134846578 [Symsagittifera roscoffensis]|uniref:uncharacterized protein LOC134846578 n=1 Tax=Symsagittifera roscoffensis TaxID=84072 RepID=UPI00307B6613